MKVEFSDLPQDTIYKIGSFLLKDKTINKIFHKKEDTKLLNILFNKIPDLKNEIKEYLKSY